MRTDSSYLKNDFKRLFGWMRLLRLSTSQVIGLVIPWAKICVLYGIQEILSFQYKQYFIFSIRASYWQKCIQNCQKINSLLVINSLNKFIRIWVCVYYRRNRVQHHFPIHLSLKMRMFRLQNKDRTSIRLTNVYLPIKFSKYLHDSYL